MNPNAQNKMTENKDQKEEKRDIRKLIILILLLIIVIMSMSIVSFVKNAEFKKSDGNPGEKPSGPVNPPKPPGPGLDTWKVEFAKIDTKETIGYARNKSKPTYNGTSVTFNVQLVNPGDKITYEITLKNYGTLDAKLAKILIADEEDEVILCNVIGIEQDYVLKAGKSIKIEVEVEYNSNYYEKEYSKQILVSLPFIQA